MIRLSEQAKKNLRSALIFVIGVIVTIIFTKTSDKIFPSDPVVVKEYTDTIKIVHDYRIPNSLSDDSTRLELEKKIKNLELLNNYDQQIKQRIALTRQSNRIAPNLVLTNKAGDIGRKGYTYGNSSSYFSSECPTLSNDFIDLSFIFFNSDIIRDIAYLRVNIYRFDSLNSSEARTFVLEEFYEIKPKDNFIRISNDLSKGKYEVIYGFVFKSDLSKKYPTYYFKKCVLTK